MTRVMPVDAFEKVIGARAKIQKTGYCVFERRPRIGSHPPIRSQLLSSCIMLGERGNFKEVKRFGPWCFGPKNSLDQDTVT